MQMSSGRTGARVSDRSVASRSAATRRVIVGPTENGAPLGGRMRSEATAMSMSPVRTLSRSRRRMPASWSALTRVYRRLELRGDALYGYVNDGTEERLDPATLRIGAAEVPYCAVKGGTFQARLSRAAAFQLLALVERDAAGAEVLRLGDRTYSLRTGAQR